MRGQKCQERQSNVVAELSTGGGSGEGNAGAGAGLELITLDGSVGGAHGHMHVVREWLRNNRASEDAEAIIKHFDNHLGVKQEK